MSVGFRNPLAPKQQTIDRSDLPFLLTRLVQVMTTGNRKYKPFPYTPSVFDAAEDRLTREHGLKIYDEMMRDPVVKAAIRSKISVVVNTWRTVPADENDPIAVLVAEFCSDALKRMQGGSLRQIRKIFNAFRYGFSVTEKQHRYIDDGKWMGLVGYNRWHARLPHFIDFETDENGNIAQNGIIQYQGPGRNPKRLDPSRAIVYVWNDDLDERHGEADLRAAYRAYWGKENLLRLMGVHLEAQGSGRPRVKFDTEYVKKYNGVPKDLLEHAELLIDSWHNMIGFIEVPGLMVDILEANTSGTHYIEAVKYYDDEMRRAIGEPKLLTEQAGTVGSFAMAEVHERVHGNQLGEARSDVEELIPDQAFKPLLRVNRIPLRYCPGFSLSPAQPADRLEIVRAYHEALTAGSINKRAGDEDRIRELINFPLSDQAGAIIDVQATVIESSVPMGNATAALSRLLYGHRPINVRVINAPSYRPILFSRSGDDLQASIDEALNEAMSSLNLAFAKALRSLDERLEETFFTDELTRDEKLDAINEIALDLDQIAEEVVRAAKAAYRLSRDSAKAEIEAVTFSTSLNPGGMEKFEDWERLVRSKSFTWAKTMEREVIGKIALTLQRNFQKGTNYRETRIELNNVFNELAGGDLIRSGPNKSFRSPYIQETIIRNEMANMADRAKLDLYAKNAGDNGTVAGIERYEFIEPGRNHPVSKFANGLRIPYNDPREKYMDDIAGAWHHGERGGIRVITWKRANSPDFEGWSSETEILRALAKKAELGFK